MIWKISEIGGKGAPMTEVNGVWVPALWVPHTKDIGFFARLRAAWAVFRGRAEAVDWKA